MMTNWPIDDLQEAWQLATRMHDGQKYGGANQGEHDTLQAGSKYLADRLTQKIKDYERFM